MAETLRELSADNPEILDMTKKCAASFGHDYAKILVELCLFYRLLIVEFKAMDPSLRLLKPFPRVTAETRDKLIEQIDHQGVEAFTSSALEHLGQYNPNLLQMAHNSAERQKNYVQMMQGFALLYKALVEQAAADEVGSALH
jgi:hypothetical protein